MKKKLLFLAIMVYSALLSAQTFPVRKILDNGPDEKRINFVLLPDGYRKEEMNTFKGNATSLVNYFFTKSPFKEYRNFFNFHIIEVPSKESGADHPVNAADEDSNPPPYANVDTYFGSTFDFASIHRLLVPTGPNTLNVLATNFPDYDQGLVLVNSNIYGGSGGWLATASTDPSSSEVMIHEVGHSFAGLGDEYWYNCGEAPNRTANNNPATIKWKNWLVDSDIGIHQMEGNSCYRPHNNCEMRYLNREFCAVCKEAIIDRIYALVKPIESSLPNAAAVIFKGEALDFSLKLVLPQPNTLKIEWFLDDVLIATKHSTIKLDGNQISKDKHKLVAVVTDTTLMSRSYDPVKKGYSFFRTWTINNESPVAVDPVESFIYKIFPNPVDNILNVEVASSEKLMWQITDHLGKIIYSGTQNNLSNRVFFNIDVSTLPMGCYQLILRTQSIQRNFGFVKI